MVQGPNASPSLVLFDLQLALPLIGLLFSAPHHLFSTANDLETMSLSRPGDSSVMVLFAQVILFAQCE